MKKAFQRTLCALLLGLGLYSLLGFLIIPGVAQRVANQQLALYATVPARLERIEFNPFSLELNLWGLHIGAADAPQVGFARLLVDLQLDSLWNRALHLRVIQLEQPQVELLFGKSGQSNLAQLFKLPPAPAPAAEADSELFPLRIERIALVEGGLHFKDLRPSTPIEFVYNSLNLNLKNLSTLPEDNAELQLVARGPHGGQIDWQGQVSLLPLRSSGHLELQDGQLKGIWPYVRDSVPLELESGVVQVVTDYRLDLSSGTQLFLDQLDVRLAPFAVQTPDRRPLLRLASLQISDSSVDLAARQVVIGRLRSQQLETWAAREQDGQLDWQKLFATPATAPTAATPATPVAPVAIDIAPATAATTPVPPPASATPGATTEPARPWQIILKDGQLRDYQVHLADRQPATPVALELGPLNLDVENFDSLAQAPFSLRLDSGLGKQGRISAAGPVQLNPPSARLQVSSENIDLRLAQAYISPFMRLELRSGLLDSQLQVDLPSVDPLQLQVSGNLQVNQLHTLDTVKQRDFVRWEKLQLDGLDYRHGQQLSIKRIHLNQPYARFIINEDRTTNVNDLLIPQPPATADTPPAAAPAKSSNPPLAIHLGGIALQDGSANFADFSLTPDFATAIQQINGSIGSIDSVRQKPAKIDIKGKVDRYAPVSILGSLNPFDPLAKLDIAVDFKRVELTTITPYSGKFAGYRIKKGRLNLNLHYRIENGQLNAENKLVLEQLQLGEQVDSPDAVDLPIRLAIALLKDPEGKIDIDLPISGNLNDPQFSVVPILWQTLRNLIVRAVQAPFNFIAGLAAGGADVDLSQVPFNAGSSELDKGAQATLDTLAAALKERPALRLEIEGSSAASSDGPLLAVQRLHSEYQNTWYKMEQRAGEEVPASAADIEVPEDEKPVLLEGIYRARLKQQPPAEWAELDSEVRADKLRDAVLASWGSSDLLLRKLAQERGASVKQYLVQQGGLADERIYLLDVRTAPGNAGEQQVPTLLQLDSE
ncbi:DUF748 domain-containing protein [Pseudomonas sp. N040]|uniref:DUF748 domain-containing protein n=1 Tax=Pseudomonas sp. N040 TaxID=2785325 RepID=UPI0018A31097|nr:DUF748 domain-containing protein [Pseudomonas sp. N040]MBF7729583.1 DUF748 domain-containing protein [Pseudomonas sp. N040]MBW7013223.1 DUF748 domain-containing protein [Pseudomonas sp. N040]